MVSFAIAAFLLLQICFYKMASVFIAQSVSNDTWRRRLSRLLTGWLILINLPCIGVLLYVFRIFQFGTNSTEAGIIAWIMYPFYMWQFGMVLFFGAYLAGKISWKIVRSVRAFISSLRDRQSPPSSPISESRRNLLSGLTVGAAAVPFATVAYGILAAEQFFDIERIRIPIRNLPEQFEGFRIVQLSDMHAGMFMTRARMSEFARAANALQPDLIALTGDYVATSTESIIPFMQAFGELRARHGVFGVLGNHDVFTGATSKLQEQFRARHFRLMINDQEWIKRDGAKLNLLGIDFLPQSDARLERVLSGLTLDGPSVLLSHQPNVLPHAATKNIDLVLSGHLHGGQVKVELLGYDIAPSKIVSPYICGLYRHEQSQMYLSRGLGTTGVPIRLNARPEITEITLVRDTDT